ncbi:hypothetical protein C0Q70_15125 [Pomacea canaliculata]|uniref:Uncharacterized protein n=1 Tax=Pomacea canaliculata TaxID=400727 RepID=A0A2T7NU01_POMCA|nr:hypothetical protein C0Q70_15125 [Pomacea canaliculata]
MQHVCACAKVMAFTRSPLRSLLPEAIQQVFLDLSSSPPRLDKQQVGQGRLAAATRFTKGEEEAEGPAENCDALVYRSLAAHWQSYCIANNVVYLVIMTNCHCPTLCTSPGGTTAKRDTRQPVAAAPRHGPPARASHIDWLSVESSVTSVTASSTSRLLPPVAAGDRTTSGSGVRTRYVGGKA